MGRVLNRSAAVIGVSRRCRWYFGRFATTLDLQLFQQNRPQADIECRLRSVRAACFAGNIPRRAKSRIAVQRDCRRSLSARRPLTSPCSLDPHWQFGGRLERGDHGLESRDYFARERPDVHVKRHLPQNRADRSRIARNALHQRATEDSARFRHMGNDPARHFEVFRRCAGVVRDRRQVQPDVCFSCMSGP